MKMTLDEYTELECFLWFLQGKVDSDYAWETEKAIEEGLRNSKENAGYFYSSKLFPFRIQEDCQISSPPVFYFSCHTSQIPLRILT